MALKGSYDIVVVGAGMAGVMAALAARESGGSVLIVEPGNVLGGQGTVGGVAGFCGDTRLVNQYFSELVAQLSKYNFIRGYDPTADRREYDLEWYAYFLQEMVTGKDIDILFHSRVVDATGSDGRIEKLSISTVGGIMECSCKFVVDASGQCIVPALSGFPIIHEGANKQLPMSLYFTLWDTGRPVEPFLPPDAVKWNHEDEIPMTSLHVFSTGKVEVKMKVVGFDAADGFSRTKAEIHARRQMMSLIYFLQTKGYAGRKLDRHVLASVSRSIGVREEKRVVGEYCLTENDVKSGIVFTDAVAVGTYHLDYHWPDKMERAGTGITTMVEPYHIPLSCMIPSGAKNILVAGRSSSGDQLAMSSFRVMATVAQMGFGAGHAVGLCFSRGCELPEVDRRILKSKIEEGGQSLDLSDYGDYLRQTLLTMEYVFEPFSRLPSSHAGTLVQLKNNRFLVAWFAGSEEGHPDVGIWMAERFQCRWTHPRLIAKVAESPHWNPVFFKAPGGAVHLYFKVGENPRNWETWRMTSSDDGTSWDDPKPLSGEEENFAPVGPVKNKPILLSNGDCLAPNSMETDDTWSVFVDRSEDGGRTWKSMPVLEYPEDIEEMDVYFPPEDIDSKSLEGKGFIQPTLWESKPNYVHMLARSTYGWIYRSDSHDGGLTWSPLYRTDIPSNNSGIDLVRLNDGHLVLALNPVSANWGCRYPLSLLLSADNGETWPYRLDLETDEGEFSYPSLITTSRGIALVYTWNRERIVFWHGSVEQIKDPGIVDKYQNNLHTGVACMDA